MTKARRPVWLSYVLALRPTQWTKNGLVLAAFLFAIGDRTQSVSVSALATVLIAAGLFCALSSGIYLVNDVKDLALDREHPTKRWRPVAAGEVPVAGALALALVLLTGALLASFRLSFNFGLVAGAYVFLQLNYTLWLKKIALVDLFVIAAGFVLRALAGAVVLEVNISPWLILCTMLLALFLALCKRRHEKVVVGDARDSAASRPSLAQYHAKLLDQLIGIVSSAVIVCYALYTLWPDTVAKFGSARLGFTIPFVLFGLFRYLDLVYRHEKGDRPEKILLTDLPLIVDLLLYAATVFTVILVWR